MGVDLGVIGAGAFGTSLAVAQAGAGLSVALWGRDAAAMAQMAKARENTARLPGVTFPQTLLPGPDIPVAPVYLVAVPTQSLRAVLQAHAEILSGKTLILCCKGVERGSGLLPTGVVADVLPATPCGVLTGPSFAADIGAGKPTALTFATQVRDAEDLQALLSNSVLRLYLSRDVAGAQWGGALKNVIAIGAGITMGADLGESARSALMTRGFAEIQRLAMARGAQSETLMGLSGFGDLILTCTSQKSRNFTHGMRVGRAEAGVAGATVEGVMTARALVETGAADDLPVTRTIAALLADEITVPEAIAALMNRPLRREN